MIELTDQQKKALELDKHISVTANAGSGKTRVLVERYVSAARSGVKVEQILCLTFTEKAALELREKIGARINAEFQAARKSGSAYAAALRDAKHKMLEANISTIHSFCSRILREFPIEAGIDANFKVLEDFDASSLKEDACAEAIRDSLEAERPDASQAQTVRNVHNLLVRIGYGKILALLIQLLDNREKIEHAKITGKKIHPDEETVRHHWFNLARAVADVIRLNVSRKKGDFSAEVNALHEAVAGDAGDLTAVLVQLKAVLDRILTQSGTPRKRDVVLEEGTTYSYDDALSILRTPFFALKDLSVELPAADTGDYLRLLRTIVELYQASENNYTRKKYLMGALDFDDLQILALRLVSANESVRNTLASRFKHVMVDEFQDTNFLQYEIFLGLLDNFTSEARLFVVGDPKQSIYRFRNAQVEVSHTAAENLSRIDNGFSLPLSESFRMNSDIAAFVNDIFPGVLRGSRVFGLAGFPSLDQAGYNALVPRRPAGVRDPIELFITEKGNHEAGDPEENGNDADAEISQGDVQAMFAAARIRQMVDSGETVKAVRNGELEKPINYGDIAILLRARSRLPLLEEALTRYGVPYVVSAGIGFYSAQEIFDLTNYLTFLLDNNADIALLGVLRSPFFGISENELYGMSLMEGENLFERLNAFAESGKAGDEVKYAASVLGEENQLAQRQTIPQLINRILERTGWLGAYRLSPTGDQRIANLRKLLGIAREFEGRGFNSLYDFVERIKYLKETAREGQAPIEEAVNAVNIMTVHAAKGLEFPVVVIPFCDATTRHGTSMIINDHVGILPFVGSVIPPALSLYEGLEKVSEQSELSRLFYVACTRAMDKLILTTASKKESLSINSFTDILSRSLDLTAAPADGYFELPGLKIRVHTSLPDAELSGESKPPAKAEMGAFFLDSIPAGIDGEIYSATVLQTFRLCPTKYFLRYRLGMPTPETRHRFDENGEHNDLILSTVKGQLVHSVLEHVLSSNTTGEEAIAAAARHAVSAGVDENLSEEERSKLIAVVAGNAANSLATLGMIAGDGKKYLEQTITRRFGSDFLTGTLDLLIEDEKGFHIYDYKTNRLDKSQEDIYAGYEIQMKLYASLCGNLRPDQKEFDVTIVFTREPGKYLRRFYSKDELSDFEKELGSLLEKIKGIETEEGVFPSSEALPTSSPHCNECEYFVGEVEKECLMKRELGRSRDQEMRNKK